ncbi:MAG: Ca2+-binding RTX toxin-like protein, partial [Verrucomicrobiales bacterium]
DAVGNVLITVESIHPEYGGDDALDDLSARNYVEDFSAAFASRVDLGADILVGGSGNDVLQGGVGDELVDILLGDNASITLADVAAYTSVVNLDDSTFNMTGSFSTAIQTIFTTFGGNDDLDGGFGNDILLGGPLDDLLIGGAGNDLLQGEDGLDVLWGGAAAYPESDFRFANAAEQAARLDLPPEWVASELVRPSGYTPALITPKAIGGVSVPGQLADGQDVLLGGADTDWLFGGGELDGLYGGLGDDYLDGGLSKDFVLGGPGNDVMLGGANNDLLRGDFNLNAELTAGGFYDLNPDVLHDFMLAGRDQIFGGAGTDILYGEGGAEDLNGERLYGGDGDDTLYGYAHTTQSATSAELTAEYAKLGSELHGGEDPDILYGSIRSEGLFGDGGKEIIYGDWFYTRTYDKNPRADTTGGNDFINGGTGGDQLFGGGGDDEIWGGPGSDFIDGQEGSDKQYGGSGIDLFTLSVKLGADGHMDPGSDTLDGHYGNVIAGDTPDDNATDILEVSGTNSDDVILFSQTLPVDQQAPKVRVDYYVLNAAPRFMLVSLLDAEGVFAIEQLQIAGLVGDDVIGFVTGETPLPAGAINPVTEGVSVGLDLTQLAERSRDIAGALDGNSGDDILIGSNARDRLDGGRGSDTLYGYGGDDRLWGDLGEGSTGDHDILYAGQGNDDLIGGQGTNELYAWSFNPRLNGSAFGVFTDTDGELYPDSGDGAYVLETTGLNRILGGIRNDHLYGGTTLDFMYGNGGNDTLYRSDGSTFESLDDGLAGDEWKEYARESDQVWYVGGTNAADEIDVNFVTEPGLLADHHLITRLTENNGNFSFSAQVRLDFNATDSEGNPVWDAKDTVTNLDAFLSAQDAAERGEGLDAVQQTETNLVNGLLPPEGDFLVILIDALDGDDIITVGPTVQKTVWVDAGKGDDRVEMRSGNAILIDKAETNAPPGGLRGRNDLASQAFLLLAPNALGHIVTSAEVLVDGTQSVTYNGLTIDNPQDVDWYSFQLPAGLGAAAQIVLKGASPIDQLGITLYEAGGETRVVEQDAIDAGGTLNGTSGAAWDLGPLIAFERITGLTIDRAIDEDWFVLTIPGRGVLESEPNEATAQSLDALGWNLAAHDQVVNASTIPHVSVMGTGDGTMDYFSFTVDVAGSFGVFDIDDNTFDTELFLFDQAGNVLAENDDAPADPGSNNLASSITYTFASAGTYTIGVGAFDSTAAAGVITGNTPQAGDTYTLHLSLQNHALNADPTDGLAIPGTSLTLHQLTAAANLGFAVYASANLTESIPGRQTAQKIDEDQFVVFDFGGLAKGSYYVKVIGEAAGRYEISSSVGVGENHLAGDPLPSEGVGTIAIDQLYPNQTYLLRVESLVSTP